MRTASFGGKELYDRLRKLLDNHLGSLLGDADKHMDENLLVYYNNQWKRYTTSSTFINNLFRYLNRYWVKRTAEEKKDIYGSTL